MNKLIKSIEHYECYGDDRLIYIERTNNEITGLNFCQGADDYNTFIEGYCENDEDLLRYYNSIKGIVQHFSEDEIEQINEVIWAWFRYKNG